MNRTFICRLPGRFKRTLALAGGALALSLVANGATSIVTQPSESALRTALAGGGSVSFACDGTIILTNGFVVTNDTVLDGSGHDVTITGTLSAFIVNSNATFTAINLAIANSEEPDNGTPSQPPPYPPEPGGGILNDGGVLNLRGVSFLTNAAMRGGAIANRNGGTVNAANCTFAGNYAGWEWSGSAGWALTGWLRSGWPAYGGAILNEDGQVSLQTCIFCGNRVEAGPNMGERPGPVAGFGGAIHNQGSLIVSGCAFQENSAAGGTGYTMWGDTTGAPGGPGGPAFGGAICNLGAMALSSSAVISNTVLGGGGGNGHSGGENSFTGQTTPSGDGGEGGSGFGGGLFNGGTASAVNSTFCGNIGTGADGGPGGPVSFFTLWLDGKPIEEEIAAGANGGGGSGCGGICATNASLYLTNCTLAFNAAWAGSNSTQVVGGLWPAGGFLVNTLLATNSPGGNASGPIVDGGHNLSSDASCAFASPSSLNNTDPRLAPLADYGGPTLTMALRWGSPAVDAGDTAASPPTDQRGFARPVGPAADIGAFEFAPVPPRIDAGPVSQTAVLGTALVLSVGVTGSLPLSYQWFFNGTNTLTGATSCLLELDDLQLSQSGAYALVVTNAFGAATSSPAMLTVTTVLRVSWTGGPGLDVVAYGGSGHTARLLASANLSNWTPMTTNQFGADGRIVFHVDTDQSSRFYRLELQ